MKNVAELFVSALSFAGCAATLYASHGQLSLSIYLVGEGDAYGVDERRQTNGKGVTVSITLLVYGKLLFHSIPFHSMRQLNNCVNHFRKWVAVNTE